MRLELDGVGIVHGSRTVVSDVRLTVEPGEVVGLLGRNGCGKSSLLRTCFRAARPAAGRVLLDGADVTTLHRREIARRVAVMSQEPADDLGLTVAESVLLGRTPHHRGFGQDTSEDRDLAQAAMARTGVLHLAQRTMPTLSGGERQRVLLARALTQEAQVLVLDEPTNHLDLAYRFELMRLVAEAGAATLVALHDLDLAMGYCDRVAVLDGGGLTDLGPPEQVLTPALVRAVFGVEAAPTVHPATGRHHLLLSGAAEPQERPA
ncbi:ABC transporter ATP-binding protein [Aeromicrobium halocynthiae]|uniref:ABC transporter ATP-binding protein n=1 Tax=Aeromicrobium halocynthiae TaxID=560557 RepID=A0ABN2W4Q0_9ACTN